MLKEYRDEILYVADGYDEMNVGEGNTKKAYIPLLISLRTRQLIYLLPPVQQA